VRPAALLYVLGARFLAGCFFRAISRFDPGHGLRMDKARSVAWAFCVLAGAALSRQARPPLPAALSCVFCACLAAAAVSDWQTGTVHDFLLLAAAACGAGLLLWYRPGWGIAAELAVFLAAQALLFRRMYGMADVLAFGAFALCQAAAGKGLPAHLLHMGVAFLLLAAVQGCRKNIGRGGDLKEPVALVPYIAVAAWLLLATGWG
jgi:GNAT superfamily N-acetyltransferase